MTVPGHLSRQIAAHLAQTSFDELPPAAVEAAKRSLLDAFGVMLAASGMGEGCAAFADFALHLGGSGPCTILGFGYRVPPATAALANGALAHAIDYEDCYDGAPVHPNAAAIPAALAICQSHLVSGRTLLAGLALGCDLVCRMGVALTADLDGFGWYPPPILGAYGAAATAGYLLGLSAEQMLDALSLTLCQATCSAEIKFSPASQIRAIRDAFPAQAGVISALLAQRDVKGFDAPLEGQAGFFNLYARGHFDPERLCQGLGLDFKGAAVSYKLWPSCRGTHAFIEAGLYLREAHTIGPDDIAHIEVVIGQSQKMLCEPAAQKQNPRTAIDAKFSIPFVLAAAMVHGKITIDSFTDEARHDTATATLAKRISYKIIANNSMTAGTVTIHTSDGRIFSRHVEHPLGHPSNPASTEALVAKFQNCAARAIRPLHDAASLKIVTAIQSLEIAPDAGVALFDGKNQKLPL